MKISDSLTSFVILLGVPRLVSSYSFNSYARDEDLYIRVVFEICCARGVLQNAEYYCLVADCFTCVYSPVIAFICKLLQRANTIFMGY